MACGSWRKPGYAACSEALAGYDVRTHWRASTVRCWSSPVATIQRPVIAHRRLAVSAGREAFHRKGIGTPERETLDFAGVPEAHNDCPCGRTG